MKVRWTESSLRLRITPDELESIGHRQRITQGFVVNGRTVWVVEVLPSDTISSLHVFDDSPGVALLLGPADRTTLLAPEHEGIYLTDAESGVRFYVEKDFPCAHPRAPEVAEPHTDTFPPPEGFIERKSGDAFEKK